MMDGFDPRLNGLPVFRSGDNVFIIKQPEPSLDSMQRMADRMGMMMKQYRCPFSIVDEFEMWWQWHERLHVRKQSTGEIMWAMNVDPKRAKEFEVERVIEIKARHWMGEIRPTMPGLGLCRASV